MVTFLLSTMNNDMYQFNLNNKTVTAYDLINHN